MPLRRITRIISARDAEIKCRPTSTNCRIGRSSAGITKSLAEPLAAVRHRQGRLIGRMEGLGFPLRSEAVLQTLTEDVLKSSEIEGEILDRDQVRSSIARRLGMDIGALTPADRNVEGVVEMMLDATQNYARAADRRAAVRLARGAVSDRAQRHAPHHGRRVARRHDRADAGRLGPVGRERVHYEAPAAPSSMRR